MLCLTVTKRACTGFFRQASAVLISIVMFVAGSVLYGLLRQVEKANTKLCIVTFAECVEIRDRSPVVLQAWEHSHRSGQSCKGREAVVMIRGQGVRPNINRTFIGNIERGSLPGVTQAKSSDWYYWRQETIHYPFFRNIDSNVGPQLALFGIAPQPW